MKNRDELWAQFVDLCVKVLVKEAAEIVPEAVFSDLGVDSLDLVEFVMALEEEFDISVPEAELEGITSVGAAFELILRKLAEKEAGSEASNEPGED